jgi:hypothetical protein
MGGGGDIGAAFSRLGQLLSYQGGPVNWDLARDVARQAVSAAGDRSVATAEREQVLDAMRLADLWLDEATAFPAATFAVKAWSRAEWVEATLPAWRELVDPVAGKVVDSMGTMLAGEGGPMAQLGAMPEQAAALAGPLQQMMRSIGGAMFGTQIGQAIGALALEVVGSTESGCRWRRPGRRHCCRPTSPRSAPGSRCRPTRSGCTWPCARPHTSGCSPTSRGCAPTSSMRSPPTRGASRSTPRASRRRSAASTPPTPSPCSGR